LIRLISDLLALQDPSARHTILTRAIVSLIIIIASLIYAGFFGVLGSVVVYLLGVELMGMDLLWLYAPQILAIFVGLVSGFRQLVDYWRHFGHG